MPVSATPHLEQVRRQRERPKPLLTALKCVFSLCLCPEDYEDIRGFIAGGYVELDNNEGPLTSLVGLKTLTIKIKTSYFTVLCTPLVSTVEIPIKVPFFLLWLENGLKCL